jgi:hypothetical protein
LSTTKLSLNELVCGQGLGIDLSEKGVLTVLMCMVRAVCPLFMFAYYVLTGHGAAESFSCLAPCNARSALLLIRLVAPVIQLRRGFFLLDELHDRAACLLLSFFTSE